MHAGEFRTFAVLIPLTLWVAIGERMGGMWGWLAAVPLAFLAVNVLPFLFMTKDRSLQWKLWLGACVAWGIWRRETPGLPGVLAHAWISIGILYLAAALVLDWRSAMTWPGKMGMAWRAFLCVASHGAAFAGGTFAWGWYWGIACMAAVSGLWCLAILNPGSQVLGPVYQTTDGNEPLLTIDDGPDPRDTPVLLDLLDSHGVKAIFFMIGEKARAHPDLVREVVKRGHEIGNHTLTHPQGSFWSAGPGRTWREITGCQEVLTEITGKAPRWFRAPVGHRNLFTHPVCTLLDLRVMGWNRRGYDAVEKDAGKVLARILPDMRPGDIVLIHEATPIAKEVLAGVLGAVQESRQASK